MGIDVNSLYTVTARAFAEEITGNADAIELPRQWTFALRRALDRGIAEVEPKWAAAPVTRPASLGVVLKTDDSDQNRWVCCVCGEIGPNPAFSIDGFTLGDHLVDKHCLTGEATALLRRLADLVAQLPIDQVGDYPEPTR